jgi:hypothetical protein
MPIPIIVYALGEVAVSACVWGWRGYQAYEVAQTAREALEMANSIAAAKEKIEKELKEIIDSMSEEIATKSSTFALADNGGNVTVLRRPDESIWKEYIARKVPFRPAISAVCRIALATPITVPRRIRKKIPGEAVEATVEIFLKQTTASIIFETIDSLLGWQSPLKAEPTYDSKSKTAHLGTPLTRPKRISDIFPFWPRPRGSVAPDLVIVEYRQKPFEIENAFVAVEIKFPGDWIQELQMQQYTRLMTPEMGLDRQDRGRNKVALLRVPEDCTDLARRTTQARKKPSGKAGRK